MGLTKKLLDEERYKDCQFDLEYDEYLYYLLKGGQESQKKKTLQQRIRKAIQSTLGGAKNLLTLRSRKDSKRGIHGDYRSIKFTFSEKRNLF